MLIQPSRQTSLASGPIQPHRAAPRMPSFSCVFGFEGFGDSSVDSGLEVVGLAEVAAVIHSSVLSWAERIFVLARLIRDFTVPTSQGSPEGRKEAHQHDDARG